MNNIKTRMNNINIEDSYQRTIANKQFLPNLFLTAFYWFRLNRSLILTNTREFSVNVFK